MGENGASGRPVLRSRRRRVLDDEPEILHAVPPHQRALARQAATAPVLLLEPGPAPLQEWFAGSLGGPGLLVLQGTLAREVTVEGRTATELLGRGDMLRPWDVRGSGPVQAGIDWLVLTTTQLALLDRAFAERTRAWPAIADALLVRLARRAHAVAVQRAIASHPRVDMRVAMLLWHLAERWGTAQRDHEVRFTLPLTHKLLGELVSAERPTVSHALGRLSRAGLLRRCGAEWYLRGTPEDHAAVALRPLPPRRVSAHTAAVAAPAQG
jgi:CRP/FNR family cyclic AMP-dependent transcriptional regulator